MANQSSGPIGVGGGVLRRLPAVDTAATDSEPVGPEADELISYFFPVEIEVRNESESVDKDAIVAEALRRLTEGIRSV